MFFIHPCVRFLFFTEDSLTNICQNEAKRGRRIQWKKQKLREEEKAVEIAKGERNDTI